MDVAITGGTGFIGRALVRRHLANGDSVRILSRRPADPGVFSGTVKVYSGDLASEADAASLRRFAEGADVLYNCAGEISDAGRMRAVHVEGTRRLVEAAKGNVGHYVQLSSTGAYGPQHGVVTEDTPSGPVGVYEITKAESDEAVRNAAGHGGFTCTVLRPSIVFGPGMKNRSLRQMGAMIQRGIFFFIGPEGASANYIFVDNVVEALYLCGRLPAARGRVYNLSDHTTMENFAGAMADSLGTRRPSLRLPGRAALLAARTLGKLPGFPLTEGRVEALTTRAVYPANLIRDELGYAHPVAMEDGVAQMVRGWKDSR